MRIKNFRQAGYLMLEALIALLLAGMIVVFLGTFLQSALHLQLFSSRQTKEHYEALHVLQELAKDVRASKTLSSSGNQLYLTNSADEAIRYTFYNGVVSRAYRLGSPVPMTEQISEISFYTENGLLHMVIKTEREEFHRLIRPRL